MNWLRLARAASIQCNYYIIRSRRYNTIYQQYTNDLNNLCVYHIIYGHRSRQSKRGTSLEFLHAPQTHVNLHILYTIILQLLLVLFKISLGLAVSRDLLQDLDQDDKMIQDGISKTKFKIKFARPRPKQNLLRNFYFNTGNTLVRLDLSN